MSILSTSLDHEKSNHLNGLFVLGMHRSGTSVTTALLRSMGAYVGRDDELMSPGAENPGGFFERRDARSICNGILRGVDADWWRLSKFDLDQIPPKTRAVYQFALEALRWELLPHTPWVLKEPKLCLLLPMFRRVFDDPVIVYSFRNPYEVAMSLKTRNGIPTIVGLALWEFYNISALRNSSKLRRIFVDYGSLVSSPQNNFDRILQWLRDIGVPALGATAADVIVKPELYRERSAEQPHSQAHLSEAQAGLWTALVEGELERVPVSPSHECLSTLAEFEDDYGRKLSEQPSARFREASAEIVDQSWTIRFYEAELNRLREFLEERQTHSANLESGLRALRAETGEMRRLLAVRDGDISDLRSSVSRAQVRLRGALDAAAAQEALTNRLHVDIENYRRQVAGRRSRLRQTQKELEQTRGELAKLAEARWFHTLLGLRAGPRRSKKVVSPNKPSGRSPAPPKRDAPSISQLKPARIHAIELALSRAEEASSARKWPEAVKRWGAVLDLFPDAPAPSRAFACLARALLMQANYSASGDIIDRALAEYPKDIEIAIERAELATAMEDWPQAIVRWKEVIELGSAPARAFINLSRSHSQVGEISAAEAALVAGTRNHGTNISLQTARAEFEMSRQNWTAARSFYDAILANPQISVDEMNSARIGLSLVARLIDIGTYQSDIRSLASPARPYPRPYAIYTAIVGEYDSIPLPRVINDHFDYILFSDHDVTSSHLFKVQPITYIDADKTRSARFVKTHPHMLMQQYDIAIWMDASITILEDLFPLVEQFAKSALPIAGVPHMERSSLYDEFDACISRQKDDPTVISRQRESYEREGFNSQDLIETGWMMFNLKHPKTIPFLNGWWAEIDTHSKRDQLSVNYAMQRFGVEWFRLTAPPIGIRNSSYVALAKHGRTIGADLLDERLESSLVQPYVGVSYGPLGARDAAAADIQADVVVCVHNAHDYVKVCLESISLARHSDEIHLIIIDDGSDQMTQDLLRDFSQNRPWVTLYRNDKSVGYTRAANQGIRATNSDFVILLNSDTIVTEGWIHKMRDALFSTTGAGIVGPVSNTAGHQSIPRHESTKNQTAINELPAGISVEDMNRFCERWSTRGILPRVPLVHGFCFGIRRDVIDQIGYFDETHFPRGYGEENDYCFRAVDAGFSLVIATHTYVFHAKSKSYADDERLALRRAAAAALAQLHGPGRIQRSVDSVAANRLLNTLRSKALDLYDKQSFFE